jgi:hypothetical protein
VNEDANYPPTEPFVQALRASADPTRLGFVISTPEQVAILAAGWTALRRQARSSRRIGEG